MQQEQRRLAAILATDVAGYSRLMAADESGTLVRLRGMRGDVLDPKIAQFHGRIVGSAGDSLLVEFASAVNAVQCAVEIQASLAKWNASLPENKRMVSPNWHQPGRRHPRRRHDLRRRRKHCRAAGEAR